MAKRRSSSRRSSEAVRSEILATADRLFYEQGYRATGVNQIIEEAGAAKATFYGHFPSKEALGLEYLEHRHERWMARLRDVTGAKKTARGRALAAFSFLELWLPEVNFRGCAFLNLLGEGSVPSSLARRVLEHKTELREFLFASVVPLCPTRASTKAVADHFLLLFEGAIIEAQVHADLWPIKAASKAAAELLPAA